MNGFVKRPCRYGDAQAIIDKIERSRAQRVADEIQEELTEVLKRIDCINESYELSLTQASTYKPNGFEYVTDLDELEELLRDQVKRRRFQHSMTVFVVGCQSSLAENFTLLQQVNEFLVTASANFDEDLLDLEPNDLDIETMALTMEETFTSTETLASRLGEINHEIVQYLIQLEKKKTAKGRKRLESMLQQTKNDILKLNDTLRQLRQDAQEKDERLVHLVVQIQNKDRELLQLKACPVPEIAKETSSGEADLLKSAISNRDSQIARLEENIRVLEKELAGKQADFANHIHQRSPPSTSGNRSAKGLVKPQEMQNKGIQNVMAKSDIIAAPENKGSTKYEHVLMDNAYLKENNVSPDNSDMHHFSAQNGSMEVVVQKDSRADLLSRYHPFVKDAGKLAVGAQNSKTGSKKEADGTSSQSFTVVPPQGNTGRVNDSRTNSVNKSVSKVLRKPSTGRQDVVQSTSGVSSEPPLLVPGVGLSDARKLLAALPEEDPQIHNESFDLKDEAAWLNLSPNELPARFRQYRMMTLKRILDLEDQLDVTTRKTRSKVDSLKMQFQDQRAKWEAERKTLIESLTLLQGLQNEANQDVSLALSHLEDVVNTKSIQLPERKTSVENVAKAEELQPGVDNVAKVEELQPGVDNVVRVEELQPGVDNVARVEEFQPGVDNVARVEELQPGVDNVADLALTQLEDGVEAGSIQSPKPVDDGSAWSHNLDNTTQSPVNQPMSDADVDFKEEEISVKPDRLEIMTDDAKVQMSRESIQISSPETKDIQMQQLGTTIHQKAAEDVQSTYDTVHLVSTSVDKSSSPLNSLSDDLELDERHETLVAIRHRMEERLAKTGLWVRTGDRTKTPMNYELDLENDVQVVDGSLEGQLKIFRSQGTSPARLNRESTNDTLQSSQLLPSAINPVLEEYLKSYDDIVNFRKNLVNCLPVKDFSLLEQVTFDKDGPLRPQIVQLSQNINKILSEVMDSIVPGISDGNRNLPGSMSSNFLSLMNDGPAASFHDENLDVDIKSEVERVFSVENSKEVDFKLEYERLARILEQEKRTSSEQFHYNAALVSEMQDTIGNLKRELSNLRQKANTIVRRNQLPVHSPRDRSTSPILFTRLDSERNVKIMRKAIVEQRIGLDRCKAVLHRMKRYVDLPGQRLQQLARTYVCHRKLREIRESLDSQDRTDDDILTLLTKMEAYQKKQLEKCDEKSQALNHERVHLARELTDILSNIELESGIFLIKPMFSYKGRSDDPNQGYEQKRTRLYQPSHSLKRQHTSGGNSQSYRQSVNGMGSSLKSTVDQLNSGIEGTAEPVIGSEPTRPVWKQNESTADRIIDLRSQPDVPHLLELDVNRVIIGNNNISMKIHPNSSSVISPSSGTRSYVTASRPIGSVFPHRSVSVAGLNFVPPSTPALCGSKTEMEKGKVFHSARTSPAHGIHSMVSTPPLPPIASAATDETAQHTSEEADADVSLLPAYTNEQDAAESGIVP